MIMTTPSTIVLYGSDLFGKDVPGKNAEQLAALQQSGFTSVILWTLHVHPDGTLFYNDTVIVSEGVLAAAFSHLPDLVKQLVGSGSSVQNVLFCIGSANARDFTNIKTLLATVEGKRALARSFNALSSAMPIAGYDFDNEDLFDPSASDTVAELSEVLCANKRLFITYCPYMMQDMWNQAIQSVYTWNQRQKPVLGQSVRWWNLQCYSGGAGNDPSSWARLLPENAGVADKAAYIVPGYSASQSPSSIEATFKSLATSDPGIAGGFIWNSSAIFAGSFMPRDYAQAIINGLAAGSNAK
jgi:hypothetical protein